MLQIFNGSLAITTINFYMDVKRFQQFKHEADIIIKTSEWLVREIDNVVDQEEYYEAHPYIDTYELMEQRIDKMDELQRRAVFERNIYRTHHTKYRDLYNSEL
jgi:hypothetical protein